MKKNIMHMIALAALTLLVGCASGGGSNWMYNQQDQLLRVNAAEEMDARINAAQAKFNAADFQGAVAVYEDILAQYSSNDGSFECAARTGLCLSYLEAGNLNGFRYAAGQLGADCKRQRSFSTETQVVLQVFGGMAGMPTGSDYRMDSRIVTGVSAVIMEGGK